MSTPSILHRCFVSILSLGAAVGLALVSGCGALVPKAAPLPLVYVIDDPWVPSYGTSHDSSRDPPLPPQYWDGTHRRTHTDRPPDTSRSRLRQPAHHLCAGPSPTGTLCARRLGGHTGPYVDAAHHRYRSTHRQFPGCGDH